MIVCLCRGISEHTVKQAVEQGACTVRAVGATCRAGTGCGACHADIARIVQDAQVAFAVADSANDARPLRLPMFRTLVAS